MPYKLREVRASCGHVRSYRISEERAYEWSKELCPACYHVWRREHDDDDDEGWDVGGEGYWTDSENFVDGMGEEHHISDS